MTESQVWQALIATLRAGLDANGYSAIKIKQAFQPMAQGANTDDTIYLHKITAPRYGWQGRESTYNVTNDNFDAVGNYWVTPTFQLSAQVHYDIADINSLTAYDLADKCSAILQDAPALTLLRASSIGIDRITDVRTPFAVDDRDQFDQDASFDFVLSYNQTINSTVPKADPIEPAIHRV